MRMRWLSSNVGSLANKKTRVDLASVNKIQIGNTATSSRLNSGGTYADVGVM